MSYKWQFHLYSVNNHQCNDADIPWNATSACSFKPGRKHTTLVCPVRTVVKCQGDHHHDNAYIISDHK